MAPAPGVPITADSSTDPTRGGNFVISVQLVPSGSMLSGVTVTVSVTRPSIDTTSSGYHGNWSGRIRSTPPSAANNGSPVFSSFVTSMTGSNTTRVAVMTRWRDPHAGAHTRSLPPAHGLTSTSSAAQAVHGMHPLAALLFVVNVPGVQMQAHPPTPPHMALEAEHSVASSVGPPK